MFENFNKALIGAALLFWIASPVRAGETMARSGIPYVTDAQAQPPELVEAIRARRGGELLNLDRMLLHSPSFARGWNAFFEAARGKQLALKPQLRELAIMSIATLNKADYEWAQHQPFYLSTGGTQAQLDRLHDVAGASRDHKPFDPVHRVTLASRDDKNFDPVQRATLELTIEMTRDVAVKKETMDKVRGFLPDDQVVELVGIISAYNMVSRFLVATGIDIEKPALPAK